MHRPAEDVPRSLKFGKRDLHYVTKKPGPKSEPTEILKRNRTRSHRLFAVDKRTGRLSQKRRMWGSAEELSTLEPLRL